MNVNPSHHGLRRAHATRLLQRCGNAMWNWLPARPMRKILEYIDAGLLTGSIEAHLPDGTVMLLGGREPGFAALVHLQSWRALVRLAMAGSAGWYRAWRAGEWSSPDPAALFALFVANARSLGGTARSGGLHRLIERLSHGRRRNNRRGARRNIAEHYDLGNDFYRLWLDPGMTYSSAMPSHPHEDLETAQTHKLEALIDRLNLKNGVHLLEIGCGWGSFAEHALERAAIDYTGLTLSREQADYMLEKPALAHAHAHNNLRILLEDYRDVGGSFDAILSVEMIEAVGQRYWPVYMNRIAQLLRPGGRAALQFISIDDAIFPAYARRADFIQRYIFPGGCLISESRLRALAEQAGLEWVDQRRFGLDYAWTLRQWRGRFDTAVERGELPARFDAHFVAMWRYYLLYCEGGFAGRGVDVSQVTLVKPAATPDRSPA